MAILQSGKSQPCLGMRVSEVVADSSQVGHSSSATNVEGLSGHEADVMCGVTHVAYVA